MNVPLRRGVGAVVGGLMFVFATALLLASSHTPVRADAGGTKCEAVVGGPHCCACGKDGDDEYFCTTIQANAKAKCKTKKYCKGSCWGTVE